MSESDAVLNELLDAAESDPVTDGFLTHTCNIGTQRECYTKICCICGSYDHLVEESRGLYEILN